MKTTILIFLVLIITSCDPSYKIDKDKISSSRKFEHGFYLNELEVTKFNENGRPIEYKITKTVVCSPINRFSAHLSKYRYSKEELKTVERNRGIMDSIMELNGNSLGGEGHNIGINEYFESEKIIENLEQKYFPFKPKKKIYFKELNENYRWVHTNEYKMFDYDRGVHETLPIELKVERWYQFNFSNTSHTTNKLYFKFSRNGAIEEYHQYHQPLFGV